MFPVVQSMSVIKTSMTKREIISLVLLSLICIVPVFFGGGKEYEVVSLVFALLALFVASSKFEIGTVCAKPERALILVFVLWALINTFLFSVRPYASFVAILPIIAGAIIYIALSSQKLSDTYKKGFALALIGGALVSSLWGLYYYLSPDHELLRLSATFNQPNVFAGFLIIPIILTFWVSLFGGRFRLGGAIASIVLLASLLLSFSIGGIICVLLALGLFLIFVARESFPQKKLLIKRLLTIFFIVLVALGSSYGLYWVKFYNLSLATNSVSEGLPSIYSNVERSEFGEKGFGYRFEMMNSARVLMREKPFTGFGIETFGQEVSRVIKSPEYWSTDPHNLYLRICMELGVVGGLLFVVFIAFVVFRQGRYLISRKEDLLSAAYFSGFLGILIHNGVDIDFTFSANVILFFIVAAFLTISQEQKERQTFVFPTLFFGTALMLVPVAFIYAGAYNLTLATDALKVQKIADYEYRFNQALKFDPISPEIKIVGANVALDLDESDKALSFLYDAVKIHPQDVTTQLLLGRAYKLLGNNLEAERVLRQVILIAPYRDLEADIYLLGVLRSQGKIKEAQNVAKSGIERFPDSLFESSLWTDYEAKTMVKFQKMLLDSFLFEFSESK